MSLWSLFALWSWLLFGLLAGYGGWHRWTLHRRLGRGGFRPLPKVPFTLSRPLLVPISFVTTWLFWSWMALPPWPALLLAAGASLLVGRLYDHWQAERHEQRLESQLPNLAWQLAAALRAGRSLPLALDHAAQRLPAPSSRLALDMAERLRLGQPLEATVAELGAARGLGLLGASLAMHHRLGINLPQSLSQAAASLSRAAAVREEAAAAMAEARTSAVLVAALPLATLVLIRLSLPGQVKTVLSQPAGWVLLGLFLGAQALALAVIHRLARAAL